MTRKLENITIDQIMRLEGYIDESINRRLDKFVTKEEFDLRFDKAFGKLDEILKIVKETRDDLILTNSKVDRHELLLSDHEYKLQFQERIRQKYNLV